MSRTIKLALALGVLCIIESTPAQQPTPSRCTLEVLAKSRGSLANVLKDKDWKVFLAHHHAALNNQPNKKLQLETWRSITYRYLAQIPTLDTHQFTHKTANFLRLLALTPFEASTKATLWEGFVARMRTAIRASTPSYRDKSDEEVFSSVGSRLGDGSYVYRGENTQLLVFDAETGEVFKGHNYDGKVQVEKLDNVSRAMREWMDQINAQLSQTEPNTNGAH